MGTSCVSSPAQLPFAISLLRIRLHLPLNSECPMSKLSAIHKQIAALQAEAERITKHEMSGAIAKVKSLMKEFGVTIEHLTQSVGGKPTANKTKAGKTAKSKPARAAKYADPKTGKTWTGVGRAAGWIADGENR